MITKDELAAMIATLESQQHLSIKEEKYLAVCRALNERMSCSHNWNSLRLVEAGGRYQYCTLCGVERVAL